MDLGRGLCSQGGFLVEVRFMFSLKYNMVKASVRIFGQANRILQCIINVDTKPPPPWYFSLCCKNVPSFVLNENMGTFKKFQQAVNAVVGELRLHRTGASHPRRTAESTIFTTNDIQPSFIHDAQCHPKQRLLQ